jgi:pimeloyl-ACP methyl ester carboxylesterase
MLLVLVALTLSDTARVRLVHVAPTELLRVVETGSAAPVVLIPGLFGSAVGFRRAMRLLSQNGYRSIVIEPLGIGWSGRPERSNYSLSAQADRVAAVLDSLDLSRAIVVGHSVGAAIALRVAYRRPQRLVGVLSIDGEAAESATSPSFRRAIRFAPWIKLFGGLGLIRKQIRSGLIEESGDRSWITDEVIAGYTEGAAADLDGTLLAFLNMSQAPERERIQSRLRDIQCPVLLLVGDAPHESAPTASQIKTMRDGIPSFAVETAHGAGHYIHEEQPEAVVRALERLRHQAAGRAPADLPHSSVVGYSYLPRAHH